MTKKTRLLTFSKPLQFPLLKGKLHAKAYRSVFSAIDWIGDIKGVKGYNI